MIFLLLELGHVCFIRFSDWLIILCLVMQYGKKISPILLSDSDLLETVPVGEKASEVSADNSILGKRAVPENTERSCVNGEQNVFKSNGSFVMKICCNIHLRFNWKSIDCSLIFLLLLKLISFLTTTESMDQPPTTSAGLSVHSDPQPVASTAGHERNGEFMWYALPFCCIFEYFWAVHLRFPVRRNRLYVYQKPRNKIQTSMIAQYRVLISLLMMV